MTREPDALRSFALEMREAERGYASELLAENAKLIEVATALDVANAQLRQDLLGLEPLQKENGELRGLLDAVTLEHQKTADELAELRAQVQSERDAVAARARQLAEVSQRSRELAARFDEVDRTGERLANWFIALGRLHEATSEEQVVSLLGEVLIHLIGSQRFAVFTISSDGTAIGLTSSLGVDASLVERLPTLSGRVAGASRGVAYLRSPGDEPTVELEADLSASLPLHAHGLTLGVIALFDWAAPPPAPRAAGLEMLTLLVEQAGTALLTCQLVSALNALHTVAA